MISKFCKSHDIIDFFKLEDEDQKLFTKVSNIILEKIKRVPSDITIILKKNQSTHDKNGRSVRMAHYRYSKPGIEGTIFKSKDDMIAEGYEDDIYLFNGARNGDGVLRQSSNLGDLPVYSSQKIREMKDKGVFTGLAQIIHNATTPIPPMLNTDAVYGIKGIQVLSHPTAYLKKVIILEDSHTKHHHEHETAISSAKFITDQIRTARCFVDLFIEVPYINRDNIFLEDILGFTGGIGWTGNSISGCFATTYDRRRQLKKEGLYSECNFLNLRAHYIDQRKNMKYNNTDNPYSLYTNVYDAVVAKKNEEKYFYGLPKIIEKLKSDKGLIFESPESVTDIVLGRIREDPRMNKQLDMIEEGKIKEVVLNAINNWNKMDFVKNEADEQNTVFDSETVFNRPFLLKILEGKGTKEEIQLAWFTLVRYNTIIMDMYTIARLFRTYRDVKGENSKPATHAIFLAGNAHTIRYKEVLLELGYTMTLEKYQTAKNSAVVEFPQKPLFL